jgi:hypothetical protein
MHTDTSTGSCAQGVECLSCFPRDLIVDPPRREISLENKLDNARAFKVATDLLERFREKFRIPVDGVRLRADQYKQTLLQAIVYPPS